MPAKRHAQAVELLNKDVLTEEDKDFVFQNWHEGAEFENGSRGAFFTPWDLAFDFSFDCGGHRIIDLCAGIGMLSFAVYHRLKERNDRVPEIVCIERNPAYVAVGKKLLPEATWICADVFEWEELNLGRFDQAISNPPFGKVRRSGNGPSYKGGLFEHHVIDIASKLACEGTFIIPQNSASFAYSGVQYHRQTPTSAGGEFAASQGFEMTAGVGIDTAFYRKSWKGVSPLCEVALIDFSECQAKETQPVIKPVPIASVVTVEAVCLPPLAAISNAAPTAQLSLF